MHEQSETIQGPGGRWYNVYGQGTSVPGRQLPGTPTYSSEPEASAAAAARSRNAPRDAEAPLRMQQTQERAASNPIIQEFIKQMSDSFMYKSPEPFARAPLRQPPPLPPDWIREDQNLGPSPNHWVPPVPMPTAPTNVDPSVRQKVMAALTNYMANQVKQAGQMTKGGFHQPGGINQAAGGAMGMSGIVKNPEHPAFKALQLISPALARSLKKMPGVVEFVDRPPKFFNDMNAWGVTTPGARFTPPGMRNTVAGTMKDPTQLALAPSYMIPGARGFDTPVHEALHALSFGTMGKPGNPSVAAAIRSMLKAFPPGSPGASNYAQRLLKMYMEDAMSGGYSHAGVEANAANILKKQGYPIAQRALPK